MTEPTLPAASTGAADTSLDRAGGRRPGGALMAAGGDTVTATAGPPHSLLFIGGADAAAGVGPDSLASDGSGPIRVGTAGSLYQADRSAAGGTATPAGATRLAAAGGTDRAVFLAGSGNVTLAGQSAAPLEGQASGGTTDFIRFSEYADAEALAIGIVPAGDDTAEGSAAWLSGFDPVSTDGLTMTLSDNTTITMADFTGASGADAGGPAG